MNFEIQTTSYFDTGAKRLAKRHRSFIDDLLAFRDSLLDDPYQGVELSPGVRKVRLSVSSKGRGKSGGVRVITFTYVVDEEKGVVILLLLYDKSDADNIKPNIIRQILKDIGLDVQVLQKSGKLKPIK
jgi:mRNA-degrading endonuclease RelE of RelBE toxin-antitoxin system